MDSAARSHRRRRPQAPLEVIGHGAALGRIPRDLVISGGGQNHQVVIGGVKIDARAWEKLPRLTAKDTRLDARR